MTLQSCLSPGLAPAGIAVALAITLVSPAHGQAPATAYPLTLENCGVELTFDRAPETVVTVGQAATEALYALGLEDTVAGTSVWFTDVPEQYREINANIERMADNDPSFESVVAKRPDLVVIQFEWHIGAEGIVATREQFHELGINTYTLPADCVNKDNTAGVDGTSTELFTTQTLFQGLEELSAIFDIGDHGAHVIAEFAEREENAIARAQALDLDEVSAVFWFSSADLGIDPYVAGRMGAPAYILDVLDVDNVIDSAEEWPIVGWETIARANPTIIVIARMDRRRFPADDHEVKLDFLRSDPVTSQMDAVVNDRIVIMDAHAMDRTLRTIEGVEVLAEALDALDLTR